MTGVKGARGESADVKFDPSLLKGLKGDKGDPCKLPYDIKKFDFSQATGSQGIPGPIGI